PTNLRESFPDAYLSLITDVPILFRNRGLRNGPSVPAQVTFLGKVMSACLRVHATLVIQAGGKANVLRMVGRLNLNLMKLIYGPIKTFDSRIPRRLHAVLI